MNARDYTLALGASLRRVRREHGLSLMNVEEKSAGLWKAVVVGSYERGDRAITVGRLCELADWYRVPVADLLPATGTRDVDDPLRLARRLVAQLDSTQDDEGEER